MLKRNLEYKDPIMIIISKKGDASLFLDRNDWDVTKDLVHLLSLFDQITTLIQSRHEPTMSYIIPFILGLQKDLESLTPTTVLGKKVQTVLSSQLQLRFSDVFKTSSEYFICLVTNPYVKSYLWTFPKVFQEEVFRVFRQFLHKAASETNTTVSVSTHRDIKQKWITQQNISEISEQDIFQQWMQFPLPSYPSDLIHEFWKACPPQFAPIKRLYLLYNHIPATSSEIERVGSKCGYRTAKLRHFTKPSTLARQIFLEKNKPFVQFVTVGNEDQLISSVDRTHTPLELLLDLHDIFKDLDLVEEDNESDFEQQELCDSESTSDEEDFEDTGGVMSLEGLHPAEVHFRASRAPKNFWNQLSQMAEEEQEPEKESEEEAECYELASPTSKKRVPKEHLPRTSKRLKSQTQKLECLKVGTRIRVWWTEMDIPSWCVGIIQKRYTNPEEFKVVYDHEIEEAKHGTKEEKQFAANGWKQNLMKDKWELLQPGENAKTSWPKPK